MKYNTKSVTNISGINFSGKFDGVNFDFTPNQVRYLPSHISVHLADQIANALSQEAKEKDKELNIETERGRLLSEILGPEILTAGKENPSLREEVTEHEWNYQAWSEYRAKEKQLQKEKALGLSGDK